MDFERYRPLLFSIAYRMLGSVMEAEDMVQEAYLRVRDMPSAEINNPKGYLCTTITHLCLDTLKAARVQREQYHGIWLPEPVLTGAGSLWHDPEAQLGDKESLAMAFMMVLETLTPEERAVYLLRDIFDYDYSAIAEMVAKSPAACRQLFHRAKQHLSTHRPRVQLSAQEQQHFFQQFERAVAQGDVAPFLSLLTEEVTGYTDGGGLVHASPHPITGRERLIRIFINTAQRAPQGTSYTISELNGQPAVLSWYEGAVVAVMLLETSHAGIVALYSVVNPEKLTHLHGAV